MGLDDYVESEVAVAIAAATVIFSPRVRGLLRRGAAALGAMLLGSRGAVTSMAADLVRDARATMTSAGDELEDIVERPPAAATADEPGESPSGTAPSGSGAE